MSPSTGNRVMPTRYVDDTQTSEVHPNHYPVHPSTLPWWPKYYGHENSIHIETSIQGHGEGQTGGHIGDPASNRCISVSLQVNRTNHSKDMAYRLFELKIDFQ